MNPVQFGTASIIVRKKDQKALEEAHDKAIQSLENKGRDTIDLTSDGAASDSFYVLDIKSESGNTTKENQTLALILSHFKGEVIDTLFF